MAGCTKEQVYEGLYEGLKSREQMVYPSDEPIPQEQQNYDEYKKERDEYLNKDRQESQ
ncbi:MAG: hypothetical protein KKE17_15195 [Proteobacteria bacterium]|nr:hypothetical protein [Pseudomonadota bacterium]MBU1711345.1 hypothetical protein [Pseudomonadota bacterium]